MPIVANVEKTNGAKGKKLESFFEDHLGDFAALRRTMMRSIFDPLAALEAPGEVLPGVNLYEKDGTYTLECAIAGYRKEDVRVDVSGNVVTLNGSYSHEKADEEAHFHRKELRRGSFTRTIAMPQEIDPDTVTATMANGMLTVTLRPVKAVTSKTIPISAA